MKRIKVLALGLVLGVAGVAYAASGNGNTQYTATVEHSGGACCSMADCCDNGSCKMGGACCADHKR